MYVQIHMQTHIYVCIDTPTSLLNFIIFTYPLYRRKYIKANITTCKRKLTFILCSLV